MKKSFVLSTLFLLSLASVCFSGCQNFIKGNDLKNEIETKITYSKKKYVTVQIISEARYTNKIIPSANVYNKEYKKDDYISLEFEELNTYVFDHWEAEPADAIKFGNNKERKTTAEIIKEVSNITITPVCFERTSVTYTPNLLSTGVSVDSNIEISFSKAINPDTFDYSILIGGVDVKDLNYLPAVFKDSKSVYIKSNPNNRINMSGFELRDVTVKISDTLRDINGISLTQDSLTHTFKVNGSEDIVSPFIKSLVITRGFDNGVITSKKFSEWEDEDYKTNHASSIKINCTGTDAGSGIAKLELKQTILKQVDGRDVNIPLKTIEIKDFQSDKNNVFEYSLDDYLFSFDSDVMDGLVQIDFKIFDNSGNGTEAGTYYFIKDTYVNIASCSLSNSLSQNVYLSEFDSLSEAFSKFIFRYDSNDYWWNTSEKSFSTLNEDLKILVEWGDGNTLQTSTEFENGSDYSGSYRLFTINDDYRNATSYVKVIIQDASGACAEILETVFAAPVVEYVLKNSTDDQYSVKVKDVDGEKSEYFKYEYYRYDKGDEYSAPYWYCNYWDMEYKSSCLNGVNADADEEIYLVFYNGGIYSPVTAVSPSKLYLDSDDSFSAPVLTEDMITAVSCGPNTSSYKITIDYDTEPGIEYFVKVVDKWNTDNIYYFFEDFEFVVSFYDEWTSYSYIVGARKNGTVKESDPVYKEIIFNNRPLEYSLNNVNRYTFNYDSGTPGFVKSAVPIEGFSNTGKKDFICYYAEQRSEWNGVIPEYTKEEAENKFSSINLSGEVDSSKRLYLEIPYNGLSDGDYAIYIYVEDFKGSPEQEVNSFFGTIGIIHIDVLDFITEGTYYVDASDHVGLTFKASANCSQVQTQMRYREFDGSKNVWVEREYNALNDKLSYYEGKYSRLIFEVPNYIAYTSSTFSNNFVKTWMYCYDEAGNSANVLFNGNYYSTSIKNESVSKPFYIYVGAVNSDAFYSMIDNDSYLSLFCSAECPVLVHTFSVDDHYDYGTNIDAWISSGIEVNTRMYSSNTNYRINEAEINHKSNYVVIAHFADGNTAISRVHHKD